MADTKNLNRGDDLYEDFMKSKVGSDDPRCESKTKIDDLHSISFKYNYDCDLYWESLDDEKEFEKISRETLIRLDSLSPIELAEECGKITDHKWKGYGSISIVSTIKFSILKPDGESIVIELEDVEVKDKNSFFSSIISKCLSNSLEPVEFKYNQKKDCYFISVENSDRYMKCSEPYRSFGCDNISKSEKMLANYISIDDTYAKFNFRKPEYDDNGNVYIISDFTESEESVRFKFRNPENNKKLWNFADIFGDGDLMLIESSSGYISHKAFDNSGRDPIFTQNLWNIYDRDLSNNSRSGFLSKIFW